MSSMEIVGLNTKWFRYQNKITQEQYEGLRLGKITSGLGYSNIKGSLKTLPIDKTILSRPLPFEEPVKLSRGLYTSDSTTQYILEERDDRKEFDGDTLPVHSDTFVEYSDSNFTEKSLLSLEKLEIVTKEDPRNLDTLLHPQFDEAAIKNAKAIGKGLGASPGAAFGKIVFTADDAVKWAEKGEKVVLVRLETSPEDITGMKAAQGILTVRGGMTSHAAVVARGMGTCCVSGCGDIHMDEANKKFTLAGKTFHEGDEISIDGTTGNIYEGIIPTVDATITGEFGRVMAWADEFRTLKVRTNADTPRDAKKAHELGAEGIGLCRTEHMFFEEDRIAAFREMICADTLEERETALEKILPYQQGDFEALYEALEGDSVVIRYLDPPLHEFVPTEEADIEVITINKHEAIYYMDNRNYNHLIWDNGAYIISLGSNISKSALIDIANSVQKVE